MRCTFLGWGLAIGLGLGLVSAAELRAGERPAPLPDLVLPADDAVIPGAIPELNEPDVVADEAASDVQLVADERVVEEAPTRIRTASETRSIYTKKQTTRPAVPDAPAEYYNDHEAHAGDSHKLARRDTLSRGDIDYPEEVPAGETYFTEPADGMGYGCTDGVCSDGGCGGGCGSGFCGMGCGGLFRGMGMPPSQGCWFGDLDYLQWWTAGMDVPPLVVQVNGNNADIIFGNQPMLTDTRPGFRARVGHWFDACRTVGIQGEYLELNNITDSFFAQSNALGRPHLGRPFINALNGQQFIEDVSLPRQLAGSVLVEARGMFSSAGLRMLYNLCDNDLGCCNYRRVDFLLGYRYMQLDESLRIHEDLTSILPAPNQGNFLIDDRFQTFNDFNGGEFGWQWQRQQGRWNVNGTAKLAIGATHQVVTISGQTVTSGAQIPADNGTRPGGLLTQPSNIGTYSRNQFALVPEFGANIGYNITPHLRLQVGYTFIYWSRVVRPGDQVDLTVNPNQLPSRTFPLRNPTFAGPARPEFNFRHTDFWAQGINVGVHWDF